MSKEYVLEKSPKIWVGITTLLGFNIQVDGQFHRKVILDSVSHAPTNLDDILFYQMKGQLRKFHNKLIKYIGCGCTVDFGDFKIRMILRDTEGHLVSEEAPQTEMSPEELWIFSGGKL